MYGNSYGKVSSKCLGGRLRRGEEATSSKDRFLSQNQKAYSPRNNRRIADSPEIASRNDYYEYASTINFENNQTKDNLLTQSLPRIKNTKRDHQDPTDSTFSPPQFSPRTNLIPQNSTIQVKPKLLESHMAERREFQLLPDGFKKIFTEDKKDVDIKLPIAGYAGHRKGERSENFYGRSSRDVNIQSKKLERQHMSKVNNYLAK